jgi:type III restriction enzyme
MELNKYQRKVIGNLRSYLQLLDEHSPSSAYRAMWEARDVVISHGGGNGMPPYRDSIRGVPHVCLKVPTGGGKTFIAAAAVRIIKDAIVHSGEGAVVWLVPSDTILEQTLACLKNTNHPYRRQLQKDFPAGVEIYDKEQLLSGQNFSDPISVQEHLSVFVLSYDSFRARNKDGRRVYRENERLNFPVSATLPEGADEASLVNAINYLNPIVIVDESHHTASQLSVEMLTNINPRFILDLTATPRENSNVIAFAEANELKQANMVKLPIVVYNRADKKDVMRDALQLRAQLEKFAIESEAAGGKYIRPIVLFQAQPRGKEDAATFKKLKAGLVEGGIPEAQIAIKTADVNELRNVNLMSRDCEIRYIITVNALKEGWDCPFAYVLATLANKTSKIDVEQIVGRVLRQPYAERHRHTALNNSFVLTCSNDFSATVAGIANALNKSGFDGKDLRVAEEKLPPPPPPEQLALSEEEPTQNADEPEFLADYSSVIPAALEQPTLSPEVLEMFATAETVSQAYEREVKETEMLGFLGGLEGSMKNQYAMKAQFAVEMEGFLLPQFCKPSTPDLFSNASYLKLQKDNLWSEFSLARADSNVNFAISGGDVYAVDATDSGAIYLKMSVMESKLYSAHIKRLPDEEKLKYCVKTISEQLERKVQLGDAILAEDLRGYVARVVDGMSNDDINTMLTDYRFYAQCIQKKIEGLLDAHREKVFFEQLATREILCRPMFALPKIITPPDTLDSLDKSLYSSEAAVNPTEQKVIIEIASLPNVKWWHRNAENRNYSFCINGFINHYPDFIIMTERGNIIVVEVKGDHLDNTDSERKLRLGRKWAERAGEPYEYFMVFDNRDWKHENALQLMEFLGIMEKL